MSKFIEMYDMPVYRCILNFDSAALRRKNIVSVSFCDHDPRHVVVQTILAIF